MSDQPLKRAWGSHVSRVLSAAGFQRFDAEKTSVRGHYRYTPGYASRGCNQSWEESLLSTEERDAGYVTVTHETLDSYDFERTEKRARAEVLDEMIPAYLSVLEDAGFEVDERTKAVGSTGRYLVVRGRR